MKTLFELIILLSLTVLFQFIAITIAKPLFSDSYYAAVVLFGPVLFAIFSAEITLKLRKGIQNV